MKKDIDFLKKIKKLFLVSFKKKISLQFLKWRYLDNTLDDFEKLKKALSYRKINENSSINEILENWNDINE